VSAPESAAPLEGGPRWAESADQARFAALQRLGGFGLHFPQELARHGDVVQLAEQVLQRLHTLQVGSVVRARKEWGKEFTGVAQAPDADAQRMAALLVPPLNTPRSFKGLAMEPLQGACGDVRRNRILARRRPRPVPSAQPEFRKRALGQGGASFAPRGGALAPGDRDYFARHSGVGKKHIPVARRAERGLEFLQRSPERFGGASRKARCTVRRRRRPTRSWCRNSGASDWATPRALTSTCASAAENSGAKLG